MQSAQCITVTLFCSFPAEFLCSQPSHPTPLPTSKVILAAWYFLVGHWHLEARPLSYPCWRLLPVSFAITEWCADSYLHWILFFLDDFFFLYYFSILRASLSCSGVVSDVCWSQ